MVGTVVVRSPGPSVEDSMVSLFLFFFFFILPPVSCSHLTLFPFLATCLSLGESEHQRGVSRWLLHKPGVSRWHSVTAAGHPAQWCLHFWPGKLDTNDCALLGGAARRPLDPLCETQNLPPSLVLPFFYYIFYYICYYIIPACMLFVNMLARC